MSNDNHRDSQTPYRQAFPKSVKDDDNISTKRSSVIQRGNFSYNSDGRIWQSINPSSHTQSKTQTPQIQTSAREPVMDNSAETYGSRTSTPIMRGSAAQPYPPPQVQTSVKEQAPSAQSDPAEIYRSSPSSYNYRGAEQPTYPPPIEQVPMSSPAEKNHTAPIMMTPEAVQNPASVSQLDTSSGLTDNDFFDPLRILRK